MISKAKELAELLMKHPDADVEFEKGEYYRDQHCKIEGLVYSPEANSFIVSLEEDASDLEELEAYIKESSKMREQ